MVTGAQTCGNFLCALTTGLLLLTCVALSGNSAEKTFSTKNADEVEVISLVLASETKANNWTRDDLVCVSIDGKDPDKKLVKTLRERGLTVCKASDWRRNLSCGFRADIRFLTIDPDKTARLHVTTTDFREINTGVAHIADLLRDGEYSLGKTEGKWTLTDYIPSKYGVNICDRTLWVLASTFPASLPGTTLFAAGCCNLKLAQSEAHGVAYEVRDRKSSPFVFVFPR